MSVIKKKPEKNAHTHMNATHNQRIMMKNSNIQTTKTEISTIDKTTKTVNILFPCTRAQHQEIDPVAACAIQSFPSERFQSNMLMISPHRSHVFEAPEWKQSNVVVQLHHIADLPQDEKRRLGPLAPCWDAAH